MNGKEQNFFSIILILTDHSLTFHSHTLTGCCGEVVATTPLSTKHCVKSEGVFGPRTKRGYSMCCYRCSPIHGSVCLGPVALTQDVNVCIIVVHLVPLKCYCSLRTSLYRHTVNIGRTWKREFSCNITYSPLLTWQTWWILQDLTSNSSKAESAVLYSFKHCIQNKSVLGSRGQRGDCTSQNRPISWFSK